MGYSSITHYGLRCSLVVACLIALLPFGLPSQSTPALIVWLSTLVLLVLVLLVTRNARRDGTMTWGYGCLAAFFVPVMLVTMIFTNIPPLHAIQVVGTLVGLALLGLVAPFVPRWIRVGIYAVLTVLYIGWLARSFLVCDLNGCTPTSWNTQLAIARQATYLYGSDFILTKISIAPQSQTCTDTSTDLRMTFTYVAPDGDSLLVSMQSMRPRTSMNIIDYVTESPLPPAAIQPVLASVKIPPATALTIAHEAAASFIQRSGDACSVQMSLAATPPILDTQAAWSVLYSRLQGGEVNILQVVVDVQTGSVLRSEEH